VISIPTANEVETTKARITDIFPCPLINPTISGKLARWQGLKIMLSIPQTKEALNAIRGELSTACESVINNGSNIFCLRVQMGTVRKE